MIFDVGIGQILAPNSEKFFWEIGLSDKVVEHFWKNQNEYGTEKPGGRRASKTEQFLKLHLLYA